MLPCVGILRSQWLEAEETHAHGRGCCQAYNRLLHTHRVDCRDSGPRPPQPRPGRHSQEARGPPLSRCLIWPVFSFQHTLLSISLEVAVVRGFSFLG